MSNEDENKVLFLEKLYRKYSKKNGKYFAILYFAVLFTASFLVYNKFAGSKQLPIEKIVKLEKSYKEWQKDPLSTEKYNDLVSVMKAVPDYSIMLEGDVAQCLLHENAPSVRVFGDKVLSRAADTTSCYVEFSKASILLSEGRYDEAYVSSIELKKRMEAEGMDMLKIYPYLLFRISLITKHLDSPVKELEAWTDFETYINEKETSFISEMENDNQFKIIDYISQRKKNLSSK